MKTVSGKEFTKILEKKGWTLKEYMEVISFILILIN